MVASTAETLGTPLVCANIPWESWYLNLFPHGQPAEGDGESHVRRDVLLRRRAPGPVLHPDVEQDPQPAQHQQGRRRRFPNDSDGNAFRAVFPIFAKVAGYTMELSSPYTDGTTNYSSMIAGFKAAKAHFFTNVPLPPDFATMWKQSVQQGFRPKLATVAKVLLFPTDAYALGSLVNNVATDTWWVPTMPWTSLFTGETCQQIANDYETAGGGQWNANLSNYSLFEVAHAAFMSVNNPHDKPRAPTPFTT